jgi:hypothetical protein
MNIEKSQKIACSLLSDAGANKKWEDIETSINAWFKKNHTIEEDREGIVSCAKLMHAVITGK